MKNVLAFGLIGFLVWAWSATVGPTFWTEIGTEAKTEALIIVESAMKLSARVYSFIVNGA